MNGLLIRPFRRGGGWPLIVLDGISFEVGRGEFFGVVARNGSGKSTLLKLLAGIYRADAGRIRVAPQVAPIIEAVGESSGPKLVELAGAEPISPGR